MAKKKPYLQVGICPNCSDATPQQYIEGYNQCSQPMAKRGKAHVYGDVHTISLFRCEGCRSIVIYTTYYMTAVDIEEAEKLDPKWIFDFDRDDLEGGDDFRIGTYTSLLHPIHQIATEPFELQQEATKAFEGLPEQVPKKIREIYDEALKVKEGSPNAFAVLIGKALEGVQKDLGIAKKQLEELESLSSPNGLSHLAIRIRDLRNSAAHYSSPSDKITSKQAEDIDEFFRLLTDYVYVLPQRLRKARGKVGKNVQTISGIH